MLLALPLAACQPGKPQPTATAVPIASTAPALSINPTATPQGEIKAIEFKPIGALKPDVSKALQGFSLDIFQRVVQGAKQGENVFISPTSVWLALCMTYNGASGSTADGMAKALHAKGIALDTLNADNAGLTGVLQSADPKVKLAIANSIWLRNEAEKAINPDFLDRNRASYDAMVKALQFNDAAAKTMNQWVEDKTQGRIKDLIQPPIDPNTVMFLINAVYFKAPWKTPFDPKKTNDGAFTASDGSEITVPFMNMEDGNVGFADDSLIAARIPYASGRLEMVAMLPLKETLADFIKSLTPDKLQQTIGLCKETPMSLRFPKFKLEYEKELRDPLINMGMADAFGNADFSAMSQSMGHKLLISKVKHKSFIEVNEEGTEAAAATSVEIRTTALMQSLAFDKPFVYLIRDTQTGAILFIGTLTTPK